MEIIYETGFGDPRVCLDLTVAFFRCYGLDRPSKFAGLLDVLNNLLT